MIRFGSWFGRVAGGRAVLAAGLAVACGLGLGLAGVGGPDPAFAAVPSLPSNCQQASVGAEVTCSFGYTGSEQTFTVPAGVGEVTLTATGASGGGAEDTSGGLGGVATGKTTTLAGGQTLYVEVGGEGAAFEAGQAGAGFNGGGAGGATGDHTPEGGIDGSGGGGASDVRTASASTGLSPDTRLVVGAGGGGADWDVAGGSAGSAGSSIYGGQGGGGATLTAGGAGGGGAGSGTPGDGGAGTNLNAGDGDNGGAGGGGGYYGGGGGSADGSGGGGSSFTAAALTDSSTSIAASAGNGLVTIAFDPPAGAAGLALAPASGSVTAGGSQAYQAVTVDAFGASLADVTTATTFSIGAPGSCTGASCGAPAAGSYTVTGTDGSVTGTAALTVTKASTSTTVTSSGPSKAGDPVTFTATVSPVPDGGVVNFTSTSSSGCTSVPVNKSTGQASCVITYAAVGVQMVSASYSGDASFGSSDAGLLTQLVTRATPGLTVAPAASTVTTGGTVSATATLAGASPAPGGTVDYRYYASLAACRADVAAFPGSAPDGGTDVGIVSAAGGLVPRSATVAAGQPGTYWWAGFYSGDQDNTAAASGCTAEQVAYAVKLQYNPTMAHKGGSSIPVKVQLVNAAGTDVSAAGIKLTVIGLSPSPAPGKTPAGSFTFMTFAQGPGYQFNVKTTAYPARTYILQFTASGDPTAHTVTFVVVS